MRALPLWLIVLLAVALLGGGGLAVYNSTRGLRNNNPGNIRHGANWDGMAADQTDDDFITFVSPEYGIRAMAKLLKNYQSLYGLNTIASIINRWAPPGENDTASYIRSVAAMMGIAPDTPLTLNVAALQALVPAIIKHENGLQPYDSGTLARGIALAMT